MADVRLALQITVDGRPIPGFEDVLHQRRVCDEYQIFDNDQATNDDAPVALPVTGISTQQVIALRIDRDIKIYTGSVDDNEFVLKAGGFIVLCGVEIPVAEQLRVENEDTANEVRLKGIVAGT